MSAAAPIVRFDRVSKSYGAFRAVHDISFDIMHGEFLTLLGPSGSGKTTSLMMLAGFEMPSAGTILMDGKHIEALPAHQRDIGVVFQNYALFPHLTVRENLAFPLSVRRLPKTEIAERVEKALHMVHMETMGERKPAQLSGGQQQRVALARATIFTPRVIVLDEPLGALDKNLREHMQMELKHLHRALGITMVYVTHDQSEALTMSDRVAVFNRGTIEQIAPPEELYTSPATPFVASFIGENNLIEGWLESFDAHEARVRLAQGRTLVTQPPPPGLTSGDPVIVALRPESIALGAGEQTIAAIITEVIYLGDVRRVLVEADGIGPLSIKVSGATDGIATGRRIELSPAPSSCRVLAPEPNHKNQ